MGLSGSPMHDIASPAGKSNFQVSSSHLHRCLCVHAFSVPCLSPYSLFGCHDRSSSFRSNGRMLTISWATVPLYRVPNGRTRSRGSCVRVQPRRRYYYGLRGWRPGRLGGRAWTFFNRVNIFWLVCTHSRPSMVDSSTFGCSKVSTKHVR